MYEGRGRHIHPCSTVSTPPAPLRPRLHIYYAIPRPLVHGALPQRKRLVPIQGEGTCVGLQEKGAPRLGQVDMSDLFAANDGPVGPRDDASLSSTGGHNLRARDAMGRTLRGGRPQSLFSPQGKGGAPGAEVRRVLNLENIQDTYDDDGDDYEEDDDDEAVDNRSTHEYAQDHGTFENNQATTSNTNDVINNNNINNNNILPLPLPQPGVTFQTFPPPTTLPAQTQRAPRPSALAASASLLEQRAGYSLRSSLEWQSSVQGDTARIKNFRTEVLQSRDLITFAYMRPGSAYIQFLHSASTFSLHGGDQELRGSDFAFIGDRIGFRQPAAILLGPDQPWKWDTKRAVMDVGRLEYFYANPDNSGKLWKPTDTAAEQDARVPRLLALPPPFLRFCADTKRTPFELHQFVASYAMDHGGDPVLEQCRLILDWCIVASHCDTSPTTSILNLSMRAAPADDDVLDEWLQLQLNHTIGQPGANTPQPVMTAAAMGGPPQALNVPAAATPPPPPPAHVAPPPPPVLPPNPQHVMPPPNMPPQHPPPPPDIWAQVAAQLSQGMASVAAAMQPQVAPDRASSYEEGGKFYDGYQLAVLKGFAHTHHIPSVPQIWPMFQHTKHTDTHRDNIKRLMREWAMHPSVQVAIDRSLYLPSSTMKDILALRFAPNGTAAELATVDCGISILMCRPLSQEARTALKRRELTEERSRATRTMAEEETLLAGRSITTCPEDYNELLRCLGTYCALLHTLFGPRCMFFRHAYMLWETMNSDYVLERRHHFTPLFCRQIVWAIVEEGRAYFSSRMSPDDFTGKHPYDIKYPVSNLHKLDDFIRQQTPIIRGSFPASWGGTEIVPVRGAGGSAAPAPGQSLFPPIQAIQATPTVVSGLSAGTRTVGTAPRAVKIRGTNVHPAIKAVMEPFITRCNGTLLGPMLERLNITVADLPQIPGKRVCFNFVLGRCSQNGCRNRDGHINVADLPEEFVTSLMDTLRPAITHFLDVGPPAPRVFTPRRRRRDE